MGGGGNVKNHVRYSAKCFIWFSFGQDFSVRCIPTFKLDFFRPRFKVFFQYNYFSRSNYNHVNVDSF